MFIFTIEIINSSILATRLALSTCIKVLVLKTGLPISKQVCVQVLLRMVCLSSLRFVCLAKLQIGEPFFDTDLMV